MKVVQLRIATVGKNLFLATITSMLLLHELYTACVQTYKYTGRYKMLWTVERNIHSKLCHF